MGIFNRTCSYTMFTSAHTPTQVATELAVPEEDVMVEVAVLRPAPAPIPAALNAQLNPDPNLNHNGRCSQ